MYIYICIMYISISRQKKRRLHMKATWFGPLRKVQKIAARHLVLPIAGGGLAEGDAWARRIPGIGCNIAMENGKTIGKP